MASLDFISTIEEDDEVEREDSDSEEEASKSKSLKQHKNSSMFVEGFEFEEDGGEEYAWDLSDSVEWATRSEPSQFSSLEAKIARAREIRRLKVEEEKEAKRMARKEKGEEEEKRRKIRKKRRERKLSVEEPSNSEDEREGRSTDLSVSSEEEEEIGEPPMKESFFEHPPPQQNNDITFTSMNLSRPVLKSGRAWEQGYVIYIQAVAALGFVTPTPIQTSTIPVALMGKDICACAATGTGKTAAFMLPILERLLFRPTHSHLTRVLILLPTRELAIQVHSVGRTLAKHTDIELCLAAGGLDSKSQEAALRKNPDIVIATPGRLIDHLHNTPSFNLQTVEILVLDEADRILDEHFEEQLNEVIRLCPKSRQTMLFSATMTDQVEELARLSLQHPVRLFVNSNSEVASNLQQEFVRIKPKREEDREAIVTALCCRTFREHCLVFLHTKKLAHRMRILLGLLGLRASELHGSLTQLQRLEALKKFKDGEVDFLLATDLAARGLDIERVTTVINYGMPASVKQYIHRVGRTARAGRSGRSVTLVGERERKVLKDVVKQAKWPVKSRLIPPAVITRYRDKIRRLEPEIREILKQEEEEKEVIMADVVSVPAPKPTPVQITFSITHGMKSGDETKLRISEMEVSKARNMIEHEREIFSRPARTWMSSTTNIKRKREGGAEGAPMSKRAKREARKKKKPETSEEKAALANRLAQEHAAREAKRSRKQKKIYAIPTGKNKPQKPGRVKPQPVIKAFERELTNTKKVSSRRLPVHKLKGNKLKPRKRLNR